MQEITHYCTAFAIKTTSFHCEQDSYFLSLNFHWSGVHEAIRSIDVTYSIAMKSILFASNMMAILLQPHLLSFLLKYSKTHEANWPRTKLQNDLVFAIFLSEFKDMCIPSLLFILCRKALHRI